MNASSIEDNKSESESIVIVSIDSSEHSNQEILPSIPMTEAAKKAIISLEEDDAEDDGWG